MSFDVRVSRRAERDADAIFEWLAQRSKEGAVRWYHSFLHSLWSLPTQVARCGIAKEAEKLNIDLRQIHFKTRRGLVYRSLFVIQDNVIHVVGVRGAEQDYVASKAIELPE